ncbi:RecQ family ATP-dependent DNA helicase [Novipirellula sp. SH528]|uniref:RecQ family ATP-dependent DNA helicase n=1 Tax=Novipirellula sp. SH528 TaxID=3454466 RepID=UPI003FA0E260
MTSIKQLRNRLSEDFGFKKFRPGQSEACKAAMEGRDTLILMPTGSGKSLCYQLPGLALEGVTVVVSPLISLAEDQAKHIRELGCEAAILNSSKSAKQLREFHHDIQSGKAEFVFTTPERLQQSDICQLLSEVGVDLFVIDEAHCVSEWGHDFRPDYLCLHYARKRLGNPPTLAMTATASPQTIDQIVSCLKLSDPAIVATGTHRPNLRLSVMASYGDEEKERQLRSLLGDESDLIANEPAIVYCATTNTVERLCSKLSDLPMPTLAYHGKMKKTDRIASQEAFMNGPAAVMFATNAFGLGIDKPDIRRVIHHDIPGSIEAYYQEFGRAGRDGELAACTLLYDREDLRLQKLFAGGSLDSSQLRTAHHTLIQGVERYGDDTGSVSLKDLKQISPLGQQTLKNCFQHLASAGLVAPSGRGQWTCLIDRIDHEVTDRLADESRLRSEHRRIALDQMVQYAESAECRWSRIAKHFATQDEQAGSECCCDNCVVQVASVA